MFTKRKSKFVERVRDSLPCIGLLVFYGSVFAVPRTIEHRRIAQETREKKIVVEKLSLDLKTKRAANVAAEDPQTLAVSDVATEMVATSQRTRVQAFSRLQTIFQAHDVELVSSMPDATDESSVESADCAQRLTFDAAYGDVLSAMEVVEAEMLGISATDLVMTRPLPTDACRWEIVFRFAEEPR